MSEAPTERVHERHFTPEQANAAIEALAPLLERLRAAKDDLTDEEAHQLLADAAPTNGGGEPGRKVGVAFLEVRGILEAIERGGVILRDIDRGLIDFPAIHEGQEVYLCWELGEEEVAFWHDISSGYGGRRPLD